MTRPSPQMEGEGPPSGVGRERSTAQDDRRLTIWAALIVAVVICVSIGTPLIGTRVFFGTDMLLQYTPWKDQAPPGFRPTNPFLGDTVGAAMPMTAEWRRAILHGRFPMWTQYPSGGIPLGTLPDSGPLSPLKLPYLLLPLWYAPAVTKLLEMIVAAGFTFLFLRRLGLGRPAALIGGLVFMNCGFEVGWTNWPQAQVGAMIPALFWAVERAIDLRTLRSAALIAVAVAAMVFAGFPAVTYYALVAVGIYAVVRALSSRGSPRAERVWTLSLLAGAVILGVGITALQLLPFKEHLVSIDQGYRLQTSQTHIPLRALVTLAVPNAFGSPVDYNYFGQRHVVHIGYERLNYWEIQSFIGAAAVVLVLFAAARRSEGAPLVRGAKPYLWACVAVAGILIYVGGAPLALAQHLPFFKTNFIGRLRSVMDFFLAVLAAVGFQSLVSAGSGPRRTWPWPWQGLVWAAGAVASLIGMASVWRLAGEVGQRAYVVRHLLIPILAGAVTLAAVLLGRRLRVRGRRPLLWAVPLVIGIESLAFVVPYWPRTSKALFYPTTPAIRFLQQHLGHDRLAVSGLTLLPSATSFYGLRSATAHAFQDVAWLDLLADANQAPIGRPVFPRLRNRTQVATSPVLDRMGVRFFVTDTSTVFGRVIQSPSAGTIDLTPVTPLLQIVPGGRIRAFTVRLATAPEDVSPGASIVAEELDSSGRVINAGVQRLPKRAGDVLFIPVVESGSTTDAPLRVRISLRSAQGRVPLVGDGSGGASVATVVGGDGLRLVFVSGALIYQRLDALPRIRWAGSAEVVENASQLLDVLAAPVAPDLVILDTPGQAGSGKPAQLHVARDLEGDVRVDVTASGDGYVVVADAVQHGWRATVDGRNTRLISAEHAMGAVFVRAGLHRVELRYDPRSWPRGEAITGISLAGLLALIAWRPRRRALP